MYNLNDIIVAVSSPHGGVRSIVRITGPATVKICQQIFEPSDSSIVHHPSSLSPHLIRGRIIIDDDLDVDAVLYLFFAPHSYTGDDVAEIHIYAGQPVIEVLMNNLLNHRLRMASPGEFTARAYLNGKIDLAQAEAVNEIIVSSNTFQLQAAQKLLDGRIGLTTEKLRSQILDCLSLLEAGLDFSGEDIEFMTKEEAIGKLSNIKEKLSQLLIESGRLESVIDLPAVGIAGSPNAGKSSLLNKLLGRPRSIVSPVRKTTRDVLTGELMLRHNRCVLFDCAGLVGYTKHDGRGMMDEGLWMRDESIIDELAQQATIEALRNSDMIIFCVDISKTNWSEDISVRQLITKNTVFVATKCDLVVQVNLDDELCKLSSLFYSEFLPISAETGMGIEYLRDIIDKKLIENFRPPDFNGLALTSRHRQTITEAIENIESAVEELTAGQDEVAAMTLRAAYQHLGDIDGLGACCVDEQILQNTFSRFCIGK